MDEQPLQKMSTQILMDIKEWRRAHPRATYVEIEEEIHKRMMQLEAQLIQEAALESPSREWGRGSGADAAACPKCAVPLQARGKQKRTLQGNGGESVTLNRTYGICPKCGEGLFPAFMRNWDYCLAILPHENREHLVHLACFMPFDKAAEMVGVILSVQTNGETARQLTERMGAFMETVQAAGVDTSDSQEAKEGPVPQRCVISSDGAMVSLVHKQWAEVRTLAIGEPQEKFNAQGEREIHVGKLSYFSRLADASSFIDLAEVEIRRRKVREAKQVSAVTDGADWCQSLTEKYRPDAVRILDFPHAAEHISLLLEALEKANRRFPPKVLERCLHILKHRGPRPLLRLADRLLRNGVQQESESTHLAYLRRREALMPYPRFRQQGWPIGSGMVESANKNVVEARLKGTGMRFRTQACQSSARFTHGCL
jgi:hypothetical protein